ncbi:hypothetical protein [Microbulbifer epialgicus]|uniref:DUF4149 domain-containing protein n=1 Tax=Microbulbifer epialgicus TaxID=393907 RepID=A0ABV4P5H4_9GAMM
MRIILLFVVAAVASSSSFVAHVISSEWLPGWVSSQMQGVNIQPSWNVKYVALISSIEYGVAAVALYALMREQLIKYGVLSAVVVFSLLLTSIHGAFIRQPLMDYVIGNPLQVVFAQNAFKWLIWFLMSAIVIIGYEIIVSPKSRANQVSKGVVQKY